jgi:hypothetical protein
MFLLHSMVELLYVLQREQFVAAQAVFLPAAEVSRLPEGKRSLYFFYYRLYTYEGVITSLYLGTKFHIHIIRYLIRANNIDLPRIKRGRSITVIKGNFFCITICVAFSLMTS